VVAPLLVLVVVPLLASLLLPPAAAASAGHRSYCVTNSSCRRRQKNPPTSRSGLLRVISGLSADTSRSNSRMLPMPAASRVVAPAMDRDGRPAWRCCCCRRAATGACGRLGRRASCGGGVRKACACGRMGGGEQLRIGHACSIKFS
jgi:hypothetical protein